MANYRARLKAFATLHGREILPRGKGADSPRNFSMFMAVLLFSLTYALCIKGFFALERHYRTQKDKVALDYKAEHLSSTKNAYTYVFVGDSMAYHSVAAPVLNRKNDKGCASYSYNASYSGMDFVEALKIVEAIGHNPSVRPKYVVLDPDILMQRPGDIRADRKSWSYQDWENWELTALTVRFDEAPLEKKMDYVYDYVLNSLRAGELSAWVLHHELNFSPDEVVARLDAHYGFEGLDSKPHASGGRKRSGKPMDMENLDKLRYQDFHDAEWQKLDILIKAIQDTGAQLIFLYSPAQLGHPRSVSRPWLEEVSAHYPAVPKINMELDDDSNYNREEFWVTPVHMSTKGAERYSRHLRDMLCERFGGAG